MFDMIKRKAEEASVSVRGSTRYSITTSQQCPRCDQPMQQARTANNLPLRVCWKDRIVLPGQ